MKTKSNSGSGLMTGAAVIHLCQPTRCCLAIFFQFKYP